MRRRCRPGDVSFVGVVLSAEADALADETLPATLSMPCEPEGPILAASCTGSYGNSASAGLAEAGRRRSRRGGHRARRRSACTKANISSVTRRERSRVRASTCRREDCSGSAWQRVTVIARASPTRSDGIRAASWKFVPRDAYMPFGSRHIVLGCRRLDRRRATFVGQLSAYCVCAADGTHEHDGWHWRPSRHFRVLLEPVSAG